MRVRVRNKVYLKRDLESGLTFYAALEIIKIIIPNHARVYGDIYKYCEKGGLERDSFDDGLYHFSAGHGYVIKVKEIVYGIWMTREPRGVCYIYEPKSKPYRDQIQQEDATWLTATNT